MPGTKSKLLGAVGGACCMSGLGWKLYSQSSIPSLQSNARSVSSNAGRHKMLHMDINKTIVMSDAVQGSGLRNSINAMLADTACWGQVIAIDSNNNNQETNRNVLNNKIWKPVCISTNRNGPNMDDNHDTKLVTYGDFTREQLVYNDGSVNAEIKKQRKELKEKFTELNHPGSIYINIVNQLCEKLKNVLIVPAFWKLINHLNENNDSYSVIFRTFGQDLPNTIEEFNKYCKENGQRHMCLDIENDENQCGVIIYQQTIPHLVIGTFEIDANIGKMFSNGITLHQLNNLDRLKYYYNNENVNCLKIIKGYKNIYQYIKEYSYEKKKTMAIRDDWIYWALNGETSDSGKILPMDKSDDHIIQQIFFDDCASYVVNARDVTNHDDENDQSPKHIPFEEIDEINAVHCMGYEIMTNDNSFVDYLQRAQSSFGS